MLSPQTPQQQRLQRSSAANINTPKTTMKTNNKRKLDHQPTQSEVGWQSSFGKNHDRKPTSFKEPYRWRCNKLDGKNKDYLPTLEMSQVTAGRPEMAIIICGQGNNRKMQQYWQQFLPHNMSSVVFVCKQITAEQPHARGR